MEEIEKKLGNVSLNIQCPALYIGESLLNFEEKISNDLNPENINRLDQILVNLLNVNSGKVGIPVSIRVAQCLMFIHEQYPFENQNLLMDLVFKLNEASIFALGHIIKKSDIITTPNIDKSQDFLFKNAKKYPYPCVTALMNLITKGTPLSLSDTRKYFTYITNFASSGDESLRVISLWYVFNISDPKAIPKNNFIKVMKDFVKRNNDSFYVTNTLQYAVAHFAFLTIESLKNEGSIKGAYEEGLSIITGIEELSELSFASLLDFLPPSDIDSNIDILMQYARTIGPKSVRSLMLLFSEKTKSAYFNSISSESKAAPTVEQFNTMEMLQYTTEELHELAALAFQLLQTNTKETDTIGSRFFFKLASTEPSHAELYLRTSTLFLENPPESNPNWFNDLHAMALIASNILGAGVLDVTEEVTKRIISFAKNVFIKEKNLISIQIEAAFNLLTVLPDEIIPMKLVVDQIRKMIAFIDSQTEFNDFDTEQLKRTSAAFANFLKEHPHTPEAAHLLWLLVSADFMHSQPTMLATMEAVTRVLDNSNRVPLIAKKLSEYFCLFTPTRKHIDTLFKHPMSEQAISLLFIQDAEEELPLFTHVDENQFISYVISNYQDLILAIPKASVDKVVDFLLKLRNQLMARTLLLTLLKNPTLINVISPELIINPLIKYVSDKSPELLVHVTAECISLVIKERPDLFDSVVTYVSNSHGPLKCFIYGSLCANSHPSADFLGKAMCELDEIVTRNEACSRFALYALGLLFDSDDNTLIQMHTAETQCRLILSLMNSEISYSPTNLVQIAWCFANLLPVIAPEYQESEDLMNIICLIMQAFERITLPYTYEIRLFIMRPAYAMIKKAVDLSVIRFPWGRGCSYVERLSSLSFITDVLRSGEKINDDIIDLLNEAFILAQTDARIVPLEFINTVIRQGERLNEISDVIVKVLVDDVIPGESHIDASENAIICALNGANSLINNGVNVEKLINAIVGTASSNEQEVCNETYKILMSYINSDNEAILNAIKGCIPTALENIQSSAFFLSAFIREHGTEEIVNQYFAKLNNARKTTPYLIVFASAFIVSQKLGVDESQFIHDNHQLPVLLWGIVKRAMNIWDPTNFTWKSATKFKDEFENEFTTILCAAVIIKKKYSIDVVNEKDFTMFIEREKESSEPWIKKAAESAFKLL